MIPEMASGEENKSVRTHSRADKGIWQGGECIVEYRNVLLHWPSARGTSCMAGNGPYRCGANMVWRLPCCSCSPSADSSPVGIGRGAAGSYSNGVLRPTRFAVALIRSSWVMSCVGLYRSTSSCGDRKHKKEAADCQQALPSLPPSRVRQLLTL